MSKINKLFITKYPLIFMFVGITLMMTNFINAGEKFTHVKFNEKIILDLIFDKTTPLPEKLTYQQKFMLQISDILGQVLPSKRKINQEFVAAFENLSPAFKDKIANKAAIDDFANNHSKGEQAFAHTIAEFRSTTQERALVKNITKQQTQQHININSNMNGKVNKQILAKTNFLVASPFSIEIKGIAGSDGYGEEIKIGSWISNWRSVSKKRDDHGQAGYIGDSMGSTIGLNFSMGSDDILGIAYSRIHSAFKYKSFRTGDKVSANINTCSIYSSSQFNNINWQGAFSLGFGEVKNTRFDHLFNKNANAKFKSNGYNIDTALGYIINLDNYYLKPKLGLSYYYYNDGSYIENGVGTARHLVERRVDSSFVSLFGVEIAMIEYFNNGFKLIPTLDVSIEKAFNIKTQKVRAKYTWMNYYYENKDDINARKLDPTTFNIGTNISARKDNFKITLGYNYNLRRKYHEHQAIMGLEVLF